VAAPHSYPHSAPSRRCGPAVGRPFAGSRLVVGLLIGLCVSAALTDGSARALAPSVTSYGPSGRYSLDGQWLFRLEKRSSTRTVRVVEASSSMRGWSHARVPGAWNAKQGSDPLMKSAVAWYRKDFTLPSAKPGSTWIVRFQSANNRLRAWLNGTFIGAHTGAYVPFQFVLPPRLLQQGAVNRLVVRVDSLRVPSDLPGVNYWWNFGGLLRPVELERVDRVGFSAVQVLPQLPCVSCPARILYRVAVRNYAGAPQRVHVSSTYGPLAVNLGTATIRGGATHTFAAAAMFSSPTLWWPQSPYLYAVRLTLWGSGGHGGGGHRGGGHGGGGHGGGGHRGGGHSPGGHSGGWTPLGAYALRSGVRSIAVAPDGTLRLNGEVANLRGVGLVEDSPDEGPALDYTHEQQLISEARELGATAIRSQYPLDEHLEELADASGILLWSEIPVDKVMPQVLAHKSFREKAVAELAQNILTNSNHPSIVVWSIANELSSRPDAAQTAYIAQAAHTAHALDPTRPVGLAVAAYPAAGCQAFDYGPLDVIGLNDYFGWYPGPKGELADRNGLPAFLDAMRACYPSKALLVTEFGAEANREGPVTEPGTYAFQRDFVKFHLEAFASKPWLAGAFYWALREFRVRPGWGGGNPKPSPPMHTKGLIGFTGFRKPAFYEAQRLYRLTEQLHAPAS
jgi:beta-glucuronidase